MILERIFTSKRETYGTLEDRKCQKFEKREKRENNESFNFRKHKKAEAIMEKNQKTQKGEMQKIETQNEKKEDMLCLSFRKRNMCNNILIELHRNGIKKSTTFIGTLLIFFHGSSIESKKYTAKKELLLMH